MMWRRRSATGLALLALAAASGAYAQDYDYDALGRLTRVTHPNGITTFYVYDAAGNRMLRSRGTSTTPPTPPGAPPQAINDSASVQPNMTVYVPVLANDTGSGLTITATGSLTAGSVSIVSGGINYTAPWYAGAQSFTYTITDSQSRTATGSVSIDVWELTPPCDPPPGQMCEVQ